MRNDALPVFVRVALAVFFFDLVSKELAAALLGDSTSLTAATIGAFRFGLEMNEGAAGGIWLGAYTRLLNIASMVLSAVVAAAAVRQLSTVHRVAPIALGLIVGGALGNTVSLIVRPGVIDFLAFDVGAGAHIVANVADLAALAGILTLLPVGVTLIAQIWSDKVNPQRRAPVRTVAPAFRKTGFEREVPIALASEVALNAKANEQTEAGDSIIPRVSSTEELRS